MLDMPYINEDGSLDDIFGYIRKCDFCLNIERVYDEKNDSFVGNWELIKSAEDEIYNLFKGIRKPFNPMPVFCLSCIKEKMGYFHNLRDILELDIEINKFRRVINGKRNKTD